ncbi:hypothetical protein LPTSP3_g08130 [Leptospira kobayashii]|uniref:Uncharacterized protein n=1 Tax=Leptospira kobayashii TaxID=1917830 RepID=A0ABN6KE92_9LEPT|nr:hypothetical protein [Leptospira kobayashii]BDA77883.1 hypothetical protein LPTSP3_g08130 [Leptospira kobayashii]
MKKKISLILAFALSAQAAFAAPSSTVSVRELAQSFAKSGMTSKEANEYLQAHITPSEFARLKREIKNAEFAGTLDRDMDQIVASVQLQKSTGNYLHGNNFAIVTNAVASVGVVAIVALVVHAGGLNTLTTGGLYNSIGLGL